MSGDDYAALGRMTADAVLAGRLDTDDLAAVCRSVIDLDYRAALAALDQTGVVRHAEA